MITEDKLSKLLTFLKEDGWTELLDPRIIMGFCLKAVKSKFGEEITIDEIKDAFNMLFSDIQIFSTNFSYYMSREEAILYSLNTEKPIASCNGFAPTESVRFVGGGVLVNEEGTQIPIRDFWSKYSGAQYSCGWYESGDNKTIIGSTKKAKKAAIEQKADHIRVKNIKWFRKNGIDRQQESVALGAVFAMDELLETNSIPELNCPSATLDLVKEVKEPIEIKNR